VVLISTLLKSGGACAYVKAAMPTIAATTTSKIFNAVVFIFVSSCVRLEYCLWLSEPWGVYTNPSGVWQSGGMIGRTCWLEPIRVTIYGKFATIAEKWPKLRNFKGGMRHETMGYLDDYCYGSRSCTGTHGPNGKSVFGG
jgi:hypothetical protein